MKLLDFLESICDFRAKKKVICFSFFCLKQYFSSFFLFLNHFEIFVWFISIPEISFQQQKLFPFKKSLMQLKLILFWFWNKPFVNFAAISLCTSVFCILFMLWPSIYAKLTLYIQLNFLKAKLKSSFGWSLCYENFQGKDAEKSNASLNLVIWAIKRQKWWKKLHKRNCLTFRMSWWYPKNIIKFRSGKM